MPISKKIQKRIETLSSTDNHNKMVPYFKKKLEEGAITAQEVLDYARNYYWEEESRKVYVVNEATIDRLGVTIESLDDKEQAKLDLKFYKLAAERGSSWGNRHYAERLLERSRSWSVLSRRTHV